jgi:hypothetical protein
VGSIIDADGFVTVSESPVTQQCLLNDAVDVTADD